MPYFIQFLLKFSLSLAIMFLFYQVVLRPLTFYQWNRFYLVCYSLLSFVIPFINVTLWLGSSHEETSRLMNAIPVIDNVRLPAGLLSANTGEGMVPAGWKWLYLVLAGGALIMMIRLFLQYMSLQAIKRNAVKRCAGDVRLYDVGRDISPFSFANAIFINSRLHSEEELQKIIQHEFVHVKQKHTIDILIGELLCILNWFNPFAWLIRRAIRQNLEFIADHHVLQSGLDARQYQYLLLKVVGIPHHSITTNFNLSSLKKRITMMNKMKTARLHLVKFLFVLPILAVLLLAFRETQINKVQSQASYSKAGQINDTIPNPPVQPAKAGKVAAPPAPPAPVQPVRPVKEKTQRLDTVAAVASVPPVPPVPALPADVKSVQIDTKAVVVYKDGVKETFDLNKAEDKAAYERKFGKLPVPPTSPLKEVRVNSTSSVNIRGIDVRAQPLIIVDGIELPAGADVNSIEPNSIESIDILKDKSATDLYEQKGANGVILITTKDRSKSQRLIERPLEVKGYATTPVVPDLKKFKGLYIVNGNEVSKEEFQTLFLSGKPVEVQFVAGDEATKRYKEKGKDGVIIINTETPKK